MTDEHQRAGLAGGVDGDELGFFDLDDDVLDLLLLLLLLLLGINCGVLLDDLLGRSITLLLLLLRLDLTLVLLLRKTAKSGIFIEFVVFLVHNLFARATCWTLSVDLILLLSNALSLFHCECLPVEPVEHLDHVLTIGGVVGVDEHGLLLVGHTGRGVHVGSNEEES